MRRKAAPRRRKQPVALRITDLLREEILDHEPNHYLGSEADLLAKYGVSRPTFRQITRILQQEQILVVRRGKAGGFYTSSPAMETVGRAATNFLRRRRTTFEQLHAAASVIAGLLAREAAMSDNEVARAEFAAHRDELASYGPGMTPLELFGMGMAFGLKMAELAGNPALELQLSILYQVSLDEQRRNPSRGLPAPDEQAFRAIRIRLADAILAREPEVAAALCHQAIQIAKPHPPASVAPRKR